MDYGLEAQKAAELHLDACREAMEQWEEAGEISEAVESPASAPFCGCQTCEIREVLYAAWPILLQAADDRYRTALEEYASLGPDEIPYADTINDPPDIGRTAREALAADDVLAEQEDQNQGGGDDRSHDVHP
jgi:hypothetical protein